MSAVYDCIFGARSEDLTNSELFCTYFPSLDDFKLIVAVGIFCVNYIGNPESAETVHFLNSLQLESISLEIVRLEI